MNKTSLRILPEESPLRGGGLFLEKHEWPPTAESEVPRTLRGLARIVDGGLCHRCGSCVGICPTGVLGFDNEEYPKVINLSSCTDCDLCMKVCPGDEFQFHKFYKDKFGIEGDSHETHGHFEEGMVAYANDPDIRERSTSGGLVTAILLDLLERGEIDGAITVTSDEETLWKGKPILATTREQILGSMKSKYAIAPTNSILQEVKAKEGRYALVGLPCQIHGFLKAAELDQRIRERVVLTIGLFCHAAIEHDAYNIIWESLGDKVKGAKKFISRIGKHPGSPHLELADGTLYPVYFANKNGQSNQGYRPTSMEMINILYRLYTPARCLTCFDALAEFADIAVGDPWMAPPEDTVDFYQGWSFALVRTAAAKKLCDDMITRNKISAVKVTRREALTSNSLMSGEKRWRAFRVIETHRRQGKPIPTYGMESMPHPNWIHFLKTEIHMLTHIFCFLPKLRAGVLRFMLSNGGWLLLWLNHKRRSLRLWCRDTKELVRRKVVGRT